MIFKTKRKTELSNTWNSENMLNDHENMMDLVQFFELIP